MADFALWATACETALWPAGTFTRAYDANRKAAIEDVIESGPSSSLRPQTRGANAAAGQERPRSFLRAANDRGA